MSDEFKETGDVIRITLSPQVREVLIAVNEAGKDQAIHAQPVNHQYIVIGRDEEDRPVYRISDFYPSTKSDTAPKALLDWTEANGIDVEAILERQGDGSTFAVVYAPNQDHSLSPVGWNKIDV